MIPEEYIDENPEMNRQAEYMCLEAKLHMILLNYIVTNVIIIRKNPFIFIVQLRDDESNVLGEHEFAGRETQEGYVRYELERWIADRRW